ncbi:MAG: alpha/beta-hydrolase family protein, partial [Rhizobiaceae bacterium]
SALDGLDNVFRKLDEIVEIKIADTDALRQQSKLDWEKLGHAGRSYIALGPTAEQIEEITSRPAMKPLRVYVGMRSADTAKERAQMALEELIRVGGFERTNLVIATPTGTGWMDPAAFDTMEYLMGGDVATVAMQYSYLASWLSLLVEPSNGLVSAQALFQAVYQHWSELPREDRPKLYLFGLSLGAHNSERSASLLQILSDPIDGAVWAGPPFVNTIWNSVTRGRDEGTPAWLPTFHDGRNFRFRNQFSDPPSGDNSWSSMRIEYLQYASDPIVFFETTSFLLEPDWMKAPRGPDVSSEFAWYPFVTGLQLVIDMMIATTTNIGHGHVYHPAHYLDSWIEVTGQNGLSRETVNKISETVLKNIQDQAK